MEKRIKAVEDYIKVALSLPPCFCVISAGEELEGFGGYVSEIGLTDWFGLLLLPFIWCYVHQSCGFALVHKMVQAQRNMHSKKVHEHQVLVVCIQKPIGWTETLELVSAHAH